MDFIKLFVRSLLFLLPVMIVPPEEVCAQGVSFQLATDAQLSLSIAQEAEEAVDRAQRWLRQQPPAKDRAERLLRDYALTSADSEGFTISRCDLTPLQQAMPAQETEAFAMAFALAVEKNRHDYKRLFAFQRDMPVVNPPANWRETLALTLINAQKITPIGGHWANNPQATTWAVLTLRALLNASPRVLLAE